MAKKKQADPQIKYFPPRLMSRLEYIKRYPLTLIEAPSGFGKTTILEHFFSTAVSPAIPCYAYDFEAGSPLSGWRELCAHLSVIDPVCARELLSLGPPSEENLPELGQTLKALRCPEETYLWLDNFKLLDLPCCGPFLNLLAEHGGQGLHIVISTQPLPLSAQNALDRHGQFWQLQDESFTFDREDIAAYFQEANIPLTHSQIDEVYTLTEGWIMALCLQMMCFLATGRFEQGGMNALMEHTLWGHLAPAEQDFLLSIFIFPRITLAQASALAGRSPDETDQILRDKRYFIHFDPESRCFYPHAQLRSLLQEHFSHLSQERQREIYLQGGRVADQTGDRLNTLRFYYAAGQWERIFELPLTSYDVADVTLMESKPMILDILERTPREVRLRHPQALIPLSFALFFMGENQRLLTMRGETEAIIQESALEQTEKNALLGELELLMSFLEYNRISDMSVHHRRALELLNGPARLINLKSSWTFGSPSILYLYWRESGQLDRELEEMDQCMPVYYQLTRGHGSGAELVMRAEACLLRGEVDEALPLCYHALFLANSKHQNSIYLCGLFLLCRIAYHQQDLETFNSLRQTLQEKAAQQTNEDLSRSFLELADGFLSILAGKPEELPRWLTTGRHIDTRLVIMVQPLAHLLYSRYLLFQREYHKLLGSCSYCLSLSAIFPNLLSQVYANIFMARALLALGKRKEALQRLQQALELAMPDRLYLPFAEHYSGLRDLLACVPDWPGEIKKIAALAGPYLAHVPEEERRFTPKERSIHYYLKDGLTNKEIAKQLHLSPNTVRNTISVMLKKKHLASREQLRELPEE